MTAQRLSSEEVSRRVLRVWLLRDGRKARSAGETWNPEGAWTCGNGFKKGDELMFANRLKDPSGTFGGPLRGGIIRERCPVCAKSTAKLEMAPLSACTPCIEQV